jgi:trans-aconitate 2-methyltransferase
MATKWDPHQYLRFGEERGRPFAELVARVAHPGPRQVVDLGCGPGTATVQLTERWPEARVLGIDSSPEMIEHASRLSVPGRLEFAVGDLREWKPDEPVDVITCNAVFQWIADHVALFPRFIGYLAPGGSFAFQVPANYTQPNHVLLAELAASDRWSSRLARVVQESPVREPVQYLHALLAAGTVADVWETTYLHVLHGPDAVLEWMKGTALRPVLDALRSEGTSSGDVDEFLAAYGAVLRAAYPRDEAGRTVFPFRRIFAVASTSA